ITKRIILLEPKLMYTVLSRLKKKTLSAVMLEMRPDQAAIVSRNLLEFQDSQ
ncbi:MAG: hypothetical protein GY852_08640, partial [bacterium]|nr:hypothetical protein [bacterium]